MGEIGNRPTGRRGELVKEGGLRVSSFSNKKEEATGSEGGREENKNLKELKNPDRTGGPIKKGT